MLWNPIMASPHSCMVFFMRGATLCMACTCSRVAVSGLNGRNDFGTYLRQQKGGDVVGDGGGNGVSRDD